MEKFVNAIKNRVLVFDGSKGTMLQKYGLTGGECPESWNTAQSGIIKEIYSLYKAAGADVIQTNTFQGNSLRLKEYSLEDKTHELNYAAVALAKEVMVDKGYVAASIGPLGMLLEPFGELTFDVAYETFKDQVKVVADAGADVINFETFTDVAELRAAVLAAKEVTSLPIIASLAFEQNKRTLMGTDPYVAAVILKSLGVDMIGANCSSGPSHLLEIIKTMNSLGGIPLCVKPNAGLPELKNDIVIYNETPEDFAKFTEDFVKNGVRLIGGCCGTTPEFIKVISQIVKSLAPPMQIEVSLPSQVIASLKRAINFKEAITSSTINTNINNDLHTGISEQGAEFALEIALEIAVAESDFVYINVDSCIEKSKEISLLADVIKTVSPYISHPIVLESDYPDALDSALRIYGGRAGVVSKENNLNVINKYGSLAIKEGMI